MYKLLDIDSHAAQDRNEFLRSLCNGPIFRQTPGTYLIGDEKTDWNVQIYHFRHNIIQYSNVKGSLVPLDLGQKRDRMRIPIRFDDECGLRIQFEI